MWFIWLIVLAVYLTIGLFVSELLNQLEEADFVVLCWPFILMMLALCWIAPMVLDKLFKKIRNWAEKKGFTKYETTEGCN